MVSVTLVTFQLYLIAMALFGLFGIYFANLWSGNIKGVIIFYGIFEIIGLILISILLSFS